MLRPPCLSINPGMGGNAFCTTTCETIATPRSVAGRGDPAMPIQHGSDDPAEVLGRMMDCLNDLDRLQARLAAVHLSTAIEQLRLQFGLEELADED